MALKYPDGVDLWPPSLGGHKSVAKLRTLLCTEHCKHRAKGPHKCDKPKKSVEGGLMHCFHSNERTLPNRQSVFNYILIANTYRAWTVPHNGLLSPIVQVKKLGHRNFSKVTQPPSTEPGLECPAERGGNTEAGSGVAAMTPYRLIPCYRAHRTLCKGSLPPLINYPP